jgi:quercetin dioxygenase-like cupin family protein
MMYELVNTGYIDVESLPSVPFTPYSNDVLLKYVRLDPVRGEVVAFLKSPPGMVLPRHHHSGTVIVYTITGKWKYKEHDWIAVPGSVVYETASTEHTPQGLPDTGELLVLNIIVGELIFLDDQNRVMAIESWKTAMECYLAHCRKHRIEPRDLTAFN